MRLILVILVCFVFWESSVTVVQVVFSPAGSSLLWSGDALLFTACLRCYSCAADWSYVLALIGNSYPGSASGMRLRRRQKIARRGHQIKSVWWNWSDFSFYRAAAAPSPAWPGPPASLPVGNRSRSESRKQAGSPDHTPITYWVVIMSQKVKIMSEIKVKIMAFCHDYAFLCQ